MEETYQLIEGSPTLRDLDAENGFLWCPFGHSGRQNEPGILISRLDDGSYDVRLGTGFDSPERFATGDPDWSWMDLSVASTVELTFADDMALNDWIASETTATGSRRSSTTPLPSSSAASARISSTRSRTRSSVSPSWQPCLSMRSWTPASR